MPNNENETPRIVVGVDGSESSVEALRWALAEARLTGAVVHAVSAWHAHPGTVAELQGRMLETGSTSSMLLPPLSGSVREQNELDEAGLRLADREVEAVRAVRRREARLSLDKAVREVTHEPNGTVKIVKEVVEGRVGDVLLDAAAGAEMLVLGCHGRGQISELVLGSMTRMCTHKAPCAVVVIPRFVHPRRPKPAGTPRARVETPVIRRRPARAASAV